MCKKAQNATTDMISGITKIERKLSAQQKKKTINTGNQAEYQNVKNYLNCNFFPLLICQISRHCQVSLRDVKICSMTPKSNPV